MTERKLTIDSLRTDLAARNEGRWQPTKWPGVRFRVRSINYEPYTTARDRERERLAGQYVNVTVPDAVWNPVLGQLLADFILLEWDGLATDYDSDVARDLLRAEDGDQARDAVIIAASRVGIRDLEFVATLEKNSSPPSDIN
jgi:hypothetical protein